MSTKIKEKWLGPGKKDGEIKPIKPRDDALHIDINKKGTREWWYFDARLDNEYKSRSIHQMDRKFRMFTIMNILILKVLRNLLICKLVIIL